MTDDQPNSAVWLLLLCAVLLLCAYEASQPNRYRAFQMADEAYEGASR